MIENTQCSMGKKHNIQLYF